MLVGLPPSKRDSSPLVSSQQLIFRSRLPLNMEVPISLTKNIKRTLRDQTKFNLVQYAVSNSIYLYSRHQLLRSTGTQLTLETSVWERGLYPWRSSWSKKGRRYVNISQVPLTRAQHESRRKVTAICALWQARPPDFYTPAYSSSTSAMITQTSNKGQNHNHNLFSHMPSTVFSGSWNWQYELQAKQTFLEGMKALPWRDQAAAQ